MRSFLLLLFLACQAKAANLSQLIAEARTLSLDASSPARQRFSDSTITQFLNEAQREAITQTRCIRNSITFSLVAGTTFYPLPPNYLAMERLLIGSKYLQEMSPAALDGRSRGWESASGYPTYYFVNFSTPNMIGFAPAPGAASDVVDPIKLEYDMQPTDMVNGTDIPFSGLSKMTDYHHALAYFAASIMSSIQNQPNRMTAHMSVYTAMVGAMKNRCLERPNFLPSATATP